MILLRFEYINNSDVRIKVMIFRAGYAKYSSRPRVSAKMLYEALNNI